MKTPSLLHNLTHGALGKQILLFSLPLIVSNLLQVFFNMADIAVVGRFSGPAALGAVGSTATLVFLFTGFLMGIGNGINVITARHFGAESEKDVAEAVHTAAIVAAVTGIVLLIFGIFLAKPMLMLLRTKEDLLPGAVLYMRVYFIGMPAMAIYNFGNAVYSAVGDTKKPLYFLLAAGVLNLILNLFFVIVLHMSVAGVALASAISQYVAAFLVIRSLVNTEDIYRLDPSRLRVTPRKARDILSLGIPSGLQNAIFSIANLFIQAGVNSFDSVIVEGNSAAANADALVYDVMNAFYIACSSFMGQNYGAGNKKRVLKSYFLCLGYSFGISAVLCLILVRYGREFLSLFTTDTAVIEAGMLRLTVMGLSYPVSAFMDCTISASRGLGKSLVPTGIVIIGSCIFRVIWVYTVFAHFHTVPSLYLVYVFSWSITAIAEILYFVRVYRKTMAVF